ncbi:phytanoyl-CoA dioxygenase family protein [Sphingomonas sp. AR_OL41]|uniref:phytanoyl-CoA dioxygenase family protein n=1 Tax=Sphingomonas sp. AR_OL41 TaxID=3042729 RepID=UPI0024802A65|nr:phytanoyl-CoA dioxygenase family protein [Sphingomonas sp. AR_OL41]MDH7974493.1 phytanoyl-CoA dioxygenase family protein [Sphingomonas sp. AR_OL41]
MPEHYHPDSAHYAAAAEALQGDGWCLLADLMPADRVAALAADFDRLFDATPFCDGDFYGSRTKRFGSLLKRSPQTADFVLHPTIMALARATLGPWCDTIQLNLAQAIELHPGAPRQFPHRDQDMWQGVKGEVEYLLNVMWPLTPFTRANGATLIFPGTHGAAALQETDPGEPLVAACDPGSAIVFLGSTLHGAGANLSDGVRRGIVVSYCLGWLKPYENQWLAYPPPVARRFPPALAALVGYAQHRPNLGNYEGVCPSILLGDDVPEHIGAIDALRPDQRDAVAAHRAAQERPELKT